jgi:hypothetical protein
MMPQFVPGWKDVQTVHAAFAEKTAKKAKRTLNRITDGNLAQNGCNTNVTKENGVAVRAKFHTGQTNFHSVGKVSWKPRTHVSAVEWNPSSVARRVEWNG